MARPQKNIVEYFSHYVTPGKELQLLTDKFGNDGYAFYFRLRELLGRTPNHCYSVEDEIDWLFFVKQMGLDEDRTSDIINYSVKIRDLDKESWEDKRLWSQNFVDELVPVYEKRTSDLPDKNSFRNENTSFRVGNPSYVNENPSFRSDNSQSKVKERKVNKSKGEEIGETPTSEELIALQDKYPKTDVNESYRRFKLYNEANGKVYSNLLAAFEMWVGKDAADGKYKRVDESKPLIKHCPKCRGTKVADRNKPWDCFCDKCDVQMVDTFEVYPNQ